ncbi:COX15/CtaA family protein [Paludibacterium paludis]|uniref:Cytochrome oxidase assembly protein n=1 Tax=Paludibacterium paludis TaxID=1225769 RepID=A0A918UA79_9NEIS|nr:COX15/CtaA family protein [Paludibacterium paludis]GGY15474.1 cytochrome oxidase assembly protein [Paludibacterium paludis]
MKTLVALALLLAALVVPLGAYVRLSDAGLGCPDWPLCYGKVSPHHAREAIARDEALMPHGPVTQAKAWKEMAHRYAAASLGVLILAVAALAWKKRRDRAAASSLLALVAVQGMLGMWTVTLLLKPAIVTAHLAGGMLTVAALAVMFAARRLPPVGLPAGRVFAVRCLAVLVFCQILSGGWVSTNYAALACEGFPLCSGTAWPDWRPDGAFHIWRELGESPDGTLLPFSALVAIHWTHRLLALAVAALTLAVLILCRREAGLRPHLAWLAAVLLVQVSLGIGNVLLRLPLPLAVAHNAGAMCLFAVTALLAARVRSRVRIADPCQERGTSWQS